MPTSEPIVQAEHGFLNRQNPPVASPAASYFDIARKIFEHAARDRIVKDFFCRIGERAIRLRFVSESLVSLILPAIAHLQIQPIQQPELTIFLGDLTAEKAALPFPGGESDDLEPAGTIWQHEDNRYFVLAQNDAGALSLMDSAIATAFYWVRDAAKLPWYERGFPLRHLLAAFFHRHGQRLIHSAAAGNKNGAVLIVGRSGSGKSTTSLACATAGLMYLGDDYTLFGLEPEPRVWSLYASAKATTNTLRLFPGLKQHVHHDGGAADKSLLLLNSTANFQLTASLPVRAVLWPRISGKPETTLRPASAATLLLALAPSTIFQMPSHAEASFRALAQLVQSVPTYILESGSDMAGLAKAVEKILSQ